MMHTVLTVLFIKMDDGFSVTLAAKNMTSVFELSSKLAIVIKFTVVNQPNGFILIADRLLTRFHVNDAQAPHGEADRARNVETGIIGAAMTDLKIHRLQRAPVCEVVIKSQDA